jgi:NDP-sugar pyrophosphorylase family protein
VIGFCLAAGAGRRLAPLTDTVPKPLLAPAGRALIDLACVALFEAGADQVVVNLHHGGDQIAEYLRGRSGVRLSPEPELLGTGGGLVAARRRGLLQDGDHGEHDPIVVLTCADHVVDPQDLALVGVALERSGAPMAIGVGPGRLPPVLRLDGDRAVADPDGGWTAAGVFAVRASLLDGVEPGHSTLVDALLEPCWRRRELVGVPMRHAWADAGTLERFLDVSAGLLAGRWPYPLPAGRLDRAATGGPVFVAAGARLDPAAAVEGPLALDVGATVAPGAAVARAVLGRGASVGEGASLTGSVLGPGAEVAPGERVAGALVPARQSRAGSAARSRIR